ncbi:MAG: hypothetical protein ACLPX5_11970 [Dissulfurispiraceae bacterium]
MKNTNPQAGLNTIAVIILLVGLVSAVLIYLSAQEAPEDQGLTDSKAYLRNMELYGGKANVMMQEFRNWLDGLWHGKKLAFTVACISIVISLGFFFVARHFPDDG